MLREFAPGPEQIMTSPTATSPAITVAWVRRLDTALAGMRRAGEGTFARRAKRLSEVMHEPEFLPARAILTADLDLEDFLSMAEKEHDNLGDSLPFPSDAREEAGLALLLLDVLGADESRADTIAFNYYCDFDNNRTDAAWKNLVDQIYTPLRDELLCFLEKRGWLQGETVSPSGTVNIAVSQSSGVSIQNAGSHSTLISTTVFGLDATAQALAAFAETWRALPLPEQGRVELDADVDTLGAQLRKREPSAMILRETGKTLRSLTESIAGNLVTPAAANAALTLWMALGL